MPERREYSGKPLSLGQVDATLGRPERDGRAVVTGSEAGDGWERKRDAERCLTDTEVPEPHLQRWSELLDPEDVSRRFERWPRSR